MTPLRPPRTPGPSRRDVIARRLTPQSTGGRWGVGLSVGLHGGLVAAGIVVLAVAPSPIAAPEARPVQMVVETLAEPVIPVETPREERSGGPPPAAPRPTPPPPLRGEDPPGDERVLEDPPPRRETPFAERADDAPFAGSPGPQVRAPEPAHEMVTLRLPPLPEAPAKPPDSSEPPPASSRSAPPSAVSSPARPLPAHCPPPGYPRAAERRGQEGIVVVAARIGPDGRPRRVRVLRSSGHALLDEAAVEALTDWRFTPARDARGAELSAPYRHRFIFRRDGR